MVLRSGEPGIGLRNVISGLLNEFQERGSTGESALDWMGRSRLRFNNVGKGSGARSWIAMVWRIFFSEIYRELACRLRWIQEASRMHGLSFAQIAPDTRAKEIHS